MDYIKNIKDIYFGEGSLKELLNKNIFPHNYKSKLFFIDKFFKKTSIFKKFISNKDTFFYVDTDSEPSTDSIDKIIYDLKKKNKPDVIIGIGGGSTLDTAKAISNLLNNLGPSEKYQGWDLLKKEGVFKIGIPTISGTGAESSRTSVLINFRKKIKLGMNSRFSIFDKLILDPNLTKTVPKNQFFYTGMDTYIHSFESLHGSYKNSLADLYSKEAIKLVVQVFDSRNIKSKKNRKNLMLASYLGGLSISMSMVGVVHPLSASLSVIFGIHHCLANCIVMRAIKEFYPYNYNEFWHLAKKQRIFIPRLNLKYNKILFNKLIKSTLIHKKPLQNALGKNYKKILNSAKLTELFKKM
jgi:3-deoxy-alpha-D-manno-octulosonate 8-oxidase